MFSPCISFPLPCLVLECKLMDSTRAVISHGGSLLCVYVCNVFVLVRVRRCETVRELMERRRECPTGFEGGFAGKKQEPVHFGGDVRCCPVATVVSRVEKDRCTARSSERLSFFCHCWLFFFFFFLGIFASHIVFFSRRPA
jgi:hypothetical protein